MQQKVKYKKSFYEEEEDMMIETNRILKPDENSIFWLVTISLNHNITQDLFLCLDKLMQIQFVATRGFRGPQWTMNISQYRTDPNRLRSQWTIPVTIEHFTYNQTKKIFPRIEEIQYSYHCIEDKYLRRNILLY